MSCFCVQGLGELASRRTCQLFLAIVCAGQAWVLCARGLRVRFDFGWSESWVPPWRPLHPEPR